MTCLGCDQPVTAGRRKYCSERCCFRVLEQARKDRNWSAIGGRFIDCKLCGTRFDRSIGYEGQAQARRKFCSRACLRQWHDRNGSVAKYSLDFESYNDMLAAQGGVCAVCGKPETAKRSGKTFSLSVDHDHETGCVRGLLCGRCNTLLGMAGDDTDVLASAVRYLEGHS